jgi:hypothetical protein
VAIAAADQQAVPLTTLTGFLGADNYCQRYRPAARRPQMIDTGMSHIGFGVSFGRTRQPMSRADPLASWREGSTRSAILASSTARMNPGRASSRRIR